MKDEVIEEEWRNRDALAARYHHDLDAIVAAMQERERHPLTKIVKPDTTRPDNRSPDRLRKQVGLSLL